MIFDLLADLTDALGAMPGLHPARSSLGLLEEALRRDLHFVSRHPAAPDGQSLACGGDGKLAVLDASTGRCLASLEGHKDVVWRIAFSPDGAKLVTTCWDHVTRVWNWQSGSCDTSFPGRGDPAAIANGAPWRGFGRGAETAIECDTGECVAWLSVPLRDLQAGPTARVWAGCSGEYVVVFEIGGTKRLTGFAAPGFYCQPRR